MRALSLSVLFVLAFGNNAFAGEADVIHVELVKDGDGSFRFDVTLSHQDTGWKHYADKWEVLGPDGSILGTRTLLHPHINEQPFTRSLSGVKIPETATEVTVRGHDSIHEYGGAVIEKQVPWVSAHAE